MKSSTQHRIQLGSRLVEYQLVRSKTARKLRVRVGPNGVEVIQPSTRNGEEAAAFLAANGSWLLDQLEHAERIRRIRRTVRHPVGEILFRGELTRVRIEETQSRIAGNGVR